MSSYRSYVPWSKSNLSSSYGSSSSYSKPDSTSTPSSQYDSGYRRYGSGSISSGSGTSYKSTYTLPRDRSNTRNETTATSPSTRTSGSSSISGNSYLKDKDDKSNNSLLDKYSTSIKDNDTSKYSSKEPERKSIRDKYLSSSSYSNRDNSRNFLSSNQEKKEDPPPPPVSYTTRSLSRSGIRSRDPSPDVERTNSTSNYSSSLAPYRLYTRQHSFTRSTSRDSSSTVEPTSPTTPISSSISSNSNLQRFGSTRYGSSLRSSTNYDKPSIFGVTLSSPSDRYRSRISSISSSSKEEKEETPNTTPIKSEPEVIKDQPKIEEKETLPNNTLTENSEPTQKTFITLVTRGTSPTPPSNSTFLRSRRADLARVIEKTVERSTVKPETQDKEIQSDRGDDTARLSRYGGSTRFTSTYLDRYPSSVSRYSRYGSSYTSSRDKEKDETTKTEQETQPTQPKISERSVSKELEKLLSKANEEKKIPLSRSNIPQQSVQMEKETEVNKSLSSKSITEDIKPENKDSKEITKELEKILTKANEINKSKVDEKLQNETNNNETLVNQETKKLTKTPSSPRIISRKTSIKEKSESDSDSIKLSKTPSSPKVLSRKSSLKKTKSTVDIQSTNKESQISNSSSIGDDKKEIAENKKEPNENSNNIQKILKTDSNKSMSNSFKNISKSSSLTSEDQKPPPVPKNDPNLKQSHSLNNNQILNKDFRKSPLNMDAQSNQKIKLSKSIAAISSAPPLIKRTSPSSGSSESESESSSDSSDSSEEPSPSTPSLRPNELRKSATLLPSSADESSIEDKPPRPPSSPKPQAKTEEAKSFLMRALAPVTNLFKAMSQESADTSSCENVSELPHSGSTASLSNKSDKEINKIKKINRIESGERAWWLDDNPEAIPDGIQRIKSNKSIASESDKESKKNLKKSYKIKKQESGEKAWWLDSNSSSCDNIKKVKSNKSIASDSDKESKSSLKVKKYKIKKQESGERAWWLDSNSNIPEGVQRIKSNSSINKEQDNSLKPGKKITKIESGERAWWLDSGDDSSKASLKKTKSVVSFDSDVDLIKKSSKKKLDEISNDGLKKSRSKSLVPEDLSPYRIRHQQSGEQAWWLTDNSNVPEGVTKLTTSEESEESDEEINNSSTQLPKFPLQIQEQSEKIKKNYDNSGRVSPYENVKTKSKQRNRSNSLFIGKHTNIDEILGSAASLVTPAISKIKQKVQESESSECEEVDVKQVRIHDSTAQKPSIQRMGSAAGQPVDGQLDDTALQLYKDGDYGAYLDLEASINEQQEEFEGFQSNRKNSIVLRTQLSVRVHTIIEKLLNSEGRELRRALFSLKQIFQEDKDLVHEFVQNDGLACLIKVGSEADQNYQNYILRALGQVMLYVDGMNGVIEHPRTVQWLYTLIASRFRLVVKTALKLLLVFVEYVETNCLLLIQAVQAVDQAQGLLPWANIMKLLKDFEAGDTELLIYATTLINKTLNGIPDQDTYYDQVDSLEEQGMEGTIQRYMSKQGTDLDLLRQLQIYEAVLHHEDGDEKGTPLRQLDDTIRKTLRQRKCLSDSLTTERRKSRRQSTGSTPIRPTTNGHHTNADGGDSSGSSRSSSGAEIHLNGSPYTDNKATSDEVGVTPALRRRRERAERQRSFIREQQELKATTQLPQSPENNDQVTDINEDENKTVQRLLNGPYENGSNKLNNRKDLTPLLNAVNKLDSESEPKSPDGNGLLKKPWVLTMINDDQLKRENTVKDLTQKLSNQNSTLSPNDESKGGRIGDMTGLISKAKEGLAKSKSKAEVTKSSSAGELPKSPEPKKSETELHWEELVAKISRPLTLCDLDFTDLRSEDENDILLPCNSSNGGPPPPPPVPMLSKIGGGPGQGPPPPPPVGRCPPPMPPNASQSLSRSRTLDKSNNSTIKKNKKTVKLFWKEVRDDPIIITKLNKTGMIWDELTPVTVDTQKLEHLFESRAKDLITKKQQEMNKNKEIIVLDHKRSNAINIGMTKLPPPRSIKTAILKMDATIMNREGIEKLLTMLPTEEERSKIQEAQAANPDLPLGSAEQFLLTLASISELPARLKLWAFKLDFENTEKEIAEPLMDLKQGIDTLRNNKTFRGILSTLLSIGIFLNGAEVKGFQIEYLSKVPEVKDTVHKHSLLHHLCHMVMDKFPDSTDLYSEIGAVTRASRVDFEEVAANITRMETECKASWDHLKLIAKHDGSTMMKVKMSDFLADCAERIIVLGIIHRRVMNRFHKFELWLGIPLHRVNDMKPNELCRIVSEFALEYRTTRERVLQQLEKKANHRERNKTRGKMITEVGKFRTKEDRADAELRQLLGSDMSEVESLHGTLPWRRQRKSETSNLTSHRNVLSPLIRDETSFNGGNMTDGDDEIFESLVKTATKAPSSRTAPRERKRTRHADRKSLRRTLKNGLSEEDKKHLAAYIKGY